MFLFSFRHLKLNNESGKFVNVQPNIMYSIRHCSLFAQHEDCIKCTKSHNFLTNFPLTVYLVYPFALPPSFLVHEPTTKDKIPQMLAAQQFYYRPMFIYSRSLEYFPNAILSHFTPEWNNNWPLLSIGQLTFSFPS